MDMIGDITVTVMYKLKLIVCVNRTTDLATLLWTC